MIQRMQTLYIIIAMLLVLSIAFFCPEAKCEFNVDGSTTLGNLYLYNSNSGTVWIILFCVFSLTAIFKFNERKKQIYYINGNLIGILFLILFLFVVYFFIPKPDYVIKYNPNWMFHVGLIIGCFFFLLARRAIKKDEDLINSINRLR